MNEYSSHRRGLKACIYVQNDTITHIVEGNTPESIFKPREILGFEAKYASVRFIIAWV
jgi:hypothetical protein